MIEDDPKIGMSDFARKRHVPNSGHTYYVGNRDKKYSDPTEAGVRFRSYTPDEAGLIRLVTDYWPMRVPGAGRTDLTKVVLVPVAPMFFVGNKATITDEMAIHGMAIHGMVTRRQPHEAPYIKTWCEGVPPDPINFVDVVLYSKETLLENNGTRSGDFDWEIVSINSSSKGNEPMDPLTMARNFLQEDGGTFAPYTAQQFAEAIWYWSGKVTTKPKV